MNGITMWMIRIKAKEYFLPVTMLVFQKNFETITIQ